MTSNGPGQNQKERKNKTLEDSGIDVEIEPNDENHIDNDEEWKSIGTLEDPGIDVEIEPIDEDHDDEKEKRKKH